MPVEHKPVFSSHVSSVGYDAAAGELHVAYVNGKTVVYEGVPPGVARSVQTGPSVGSALHAEVKGRYKHRYLEG